jgi:hypothetical protein
LLKLCSCCLLCAGEDLLPLSDDAMSVVSGRSKLIWVGLRTGILRLRASMDDILFQGEENVLNVRETASANSILSFEASFGASTFCKLKT